METLFGIIIFVIIAVFVIKKIFRTRCTKCFTKYNPEQMVVTASDLKWVAKEKRKEQGRSTGGAFSVTGTNYTEITVTRYRIYYRLVTFTFKCPKCQKVRSYTKKVEIYDSSCGRSISDSEQIDRLRRGVRDILGKKFTDNKIIKIKNIDY